MAIAPSGSTAPFALLSIGATGASTNSGEAFVARASSTVGTAVNSITYVGEFRASTTNNNRLLFYAYRRTADGNWPGTGWRLQAAVDNSFTAYNDGKSYVELSNNNAIYSRHWWPTWAPSTGAGTCSSTMRFSRQQRRCGAHYTGELLPLR